MSEQDLQPRINAAVCDGCGACVTACLTSALGWRDAVVALVQPGLCTYCATCEQICEPGAIELPYVIVKDSSSQRRASNG